MLLPPRMIALATTALFALAWALCGGGLEAYATAMAHCHGEQGCQPPDEQSPSQESVPDCCMPLTGLQVAGRSPAPEGPGPAVELHISSHPPTAAVVAELRQPGGPPPDIPPPTLLRLAVCRLE